MFNRNDRESTTIKFKRIVRGAISGSRHLVLSLASNNTFTLTQFRIGRTEENQILSVPIPGGIRFDRKDLIPFHQLLTWAILHDESDIPEEYKDYMHKLKQISVGPQSDFEDEMIRIGFPPTPFTGQNYYSYPQEEEFQRGR
ncbi:MAG TPA: hypothetical protein VL443_08165 [Cyclobacteriaceae bacterium]|jgi:hypothetical protein|nr:hypothetical protein [Cyclobacteriaceae bacterium]